MTTLPDLRLSTVTLGNAPVVVTPGGTIDVGAVVQNAGVGDAGASTITFALVNAAGTVRSLTGTQSVPVVASGTSTSTQTTVTIPSGTPFATYTARACIDAAGVVPEDFDTNNCTNAAATVKVAAVVQPEAGSHRRRAHGRAHQRAALRDLHRHRDHQEPGCGGEPRLDDQVQSGQRRRPDPQEPQGRAERRGSGGGCQQCRPGRDPQGVFRHGAGRLSLPGLRRRRRGDVAEVVETNNCVTLPRGIEVRESPDLVATAVSDPPETATQGQSIDVTSTIQNVGTVTSIESTTRYYLVATDGSGSSTSRASRFSPPSIRGARSPSRTR